MTSHKNCPIFKTTSLPHCPATSKILPPPWPWAFGRPVSNESTLLLQIITCQLKENLIQGWLWYVIRSSLRVGFCFQYQLINLAWLSTDFFPFSWIQPRPQSYFKKVKTSFLPSSYSEKVCWGQGWAESWLSAFSWLHILVCAVVQKYYEITFLVRILQSTWFICTSWKRKQTMKQQPHRACEWTKSKQKQSHITFKLTTRSIVWCSPQTMQWCH